MDCRIDVEITYHEQDAMSAELALRLSKAIATPGNKNVRCSVNGTYSHREPRGYIKARFTIHLDTHWLTVSHVLSANELWAMFQYHDDAYMKAIVASEIANYIRERVLRALRPDTKTA